MGKQSDDIKKITAMAGAAIVHGYAEDIVTLNEVLAFDMRFNLRHPKIAAIYMLEIPINGCNFEVVKRDGNRYHVGGDIAGKILGEEKAYMGTLENVATQAKEQSGLIKQFCRKCDLFNNLYPQEAQEQAQKDRAKAMEDQYLQQAGGVMSRLAKADTKLPDMPVNPAVPSPVSAAVADRLRTKLRTSCEIQYTVAQTHLGKWLDFLASKRGQILSKTENFRDSDPTGSLRFEAISGAIVLSREGTKVGEWDNYDDAYNFMRLGANVLPNVVLPLTDQSYERTISGISVDEDVLRTAVGSQVTEKICTASLWSRLTS
jgi:hypothetical protein